MAEDLKNEEPKWLSSHLVGRTIKEVKYTSKEEKEELGWCQDGLLLVLDDGKEVLLVQDEEGNGPGTLWI